MKIVVNNEAEARWLRQFFEMVCDADAFDAVRECLQEVHNGIPVGYSEFVWQGLFCDAKIEVDANEPAFVFADTNFLWGICPLCGQQWEGLDPGYGPVRVKDVERLLKELADGKSYCERCYTNNRCHWCDNVYPDSELERIDGDTICRSCKAAGRHIDDAS